MDFFLNSVGLAPTDPFNSCVVQRSHFDGTHGSTSYPSTAPAGLAFTTTTGTHSISTTDSVFGGASLRLGVSPSNIKTGAHADFQFGTNDFTIEFRIRVDTVANANIYDGRVSTANAACPTIYTLSTGVIAYFVSNADRITSATGVITAATWYAIAVSRVSGTTRLFVDGTQVGANFTDSINYNASCQAGIGSGFTGGAQNVYYDELRVSNGALGAGAGRYSANYTPASAPFPDA